MSPEHVTLVHGRVDSDVDAIRAYSELLVAALREAGVAAEVRSFLEFAALSDTTPRDGAVVVQFNPYSFGRGGIAPGLVLECFRLRRSRPDIRLAVMCHETISWLPGARGRLLRLAHRAQLGALLVSVTRAWASTERWKRDMRTPGRVPIGVLPVGSNLPDMRAARASVRARLDVQDALVVASFSTGHMSHQDDFVAAAICALDAQQEQHVVALTLGAGRNALFPRSAGTLREVAPGRLDADDLAAHLAAADLYLCPYVDGASTRRGTLMAALQHGVPVVATTGSSTDDRLYGLLGEVGVPASEGAGAFAAAATRAVRDRPALAAHGSRGRELYVSRYAWRAIAEQMLTDLQAETGPPS